MNGLFFPQTPELTALTNIIKFSEYRNHINIKVYLYFLITLFFIPSLMGNVQKIIHRLILPGDSGKEFFRVCAGEIKKRPPLSGGKSV
jgi:hypothetical protein